MLQPLVAVSTDVKHLDNYDWHAAPKQYLEAAIAGAGVFPVLVPSFGDRLDLDQLLASVDGVMLTGAKSNVHPSIYGGDASEANGPYDHARDATTLPLIRKAIDYGVPLLAICRGIQELNVALGGTLGNRNPGASGLARPSRACLRQSGRAFRHSPERVDQAGKLPCGRIRPRRDPGQFGPPPGDRPPGFAPADRGCRRGRHGRGRLGRRTRAPLPSAFSGIRNTGCTPTATRQRSSVLSATPCAPMLWPAPAYRPPPSS